MAKARALYDNHSETADELSFLRDDVLEIIEKDYDGMEGWWLCGLKGKTGIAPANRLVIITLNVATSDYDLPPTKYGSFPVDKKPIIPNRGTIAEDYDTPTSNKLSSKQNFKNAKVSKADLAPCNGGDYDDYCTPKEDGNSVDGESFKSSSPQFASTNFENYFASYLKSERDMNIIIKQVTSMMKKWCDSSNYDSRAQIIKVICVSYWKAIQAYVAEAAKTIASIKGLVKTDTFKSFEEVKHSSLDLENVLDYLNKFSTLKTEDKTKIEFLQHLSALTSNLCQHSQKLSDFFSHVEKEGLWLHVGTPNSTSMNGRRDMKNKNLESSSLIQKSLRSSYGDYDTPQINRISRENLLTLSANSNVQDDDKCKISRTSDSGKHNSSLFSDQSFEATDYDVPRSSDISDYHSEGMFNTSDQSRPTSSEFLDYDSPRSKVVSKFQKIKSMESLNSELSSVIDDQVDYDIPLNNSSIIKIRTTEIPKAGTRTLLAKSLDIDKNSDRSNIFSSFEDYDIPSNKAVMTYNTIGSSHKYLSHLTQSERNLLKHYFPFVTDELKNLLVLIERFQNRLKMPSSEISESRNTLVLINGVKCLASCSHKVLFVIDSILKRLQSNADLNNQLNFSCTKICEHLKNITNLVKQASTSSSSPLLILNKQLLSVVSEFQMHVQSINTMVYQWK